MHQDTIINKFEKAGMVTVIVVWLLRIWLGPVLNYALLLTTTLLSIYYLWFGFFIFNKVRPLDLLYQETRRSLGAFKIGSSILAGFVMSYGLIAILFGFLFFPLMQTVLAIAAIFTVLMTGYVLYAHLHRKKHPVLCKRFYPRLGILIVFLMLLIAPPLELRLNILFREYPEFVEAYLDYRQNPACEESIERLREKRSRFR